MTPQAAVSIIQTNTPWPQFLLLERTHRPHDPWAGHLALPGGRRESTDISLLHTCIRETWEETGIILQQEFLQAPLEPLHAGSRVGSSILVQPFWFLLPQIPIVNLQEEEIARSFWVPLRTFQDPIKRIQKKTLQHTDQKFWGIEMENAFLWGFTYQAFKNLLSKYFQVTFQELESL